MLQQRIHGMIATERRAHRPDADVAALAVVPHERYDFLTDVVVVLLLHPAPVTRVRTAVGERVAVIGVDAEQFDAAGVELARDRANETLALVFPLVAAAGGKRDHRRTPVAVDDDAHVAAESMRVPGMTFASHMGRRDVAASPKASRDPSTGSGWPE